MNDLIVQFARLWGIKEAYRQSVRDEEISDILKTYDSQEMLSVLTKWATEFPNSYVEDTTDFFEMKLEELIQANEKEMLPIT